MALYEKFDSFTSDIGSAKHDFNTHIFKVMLTNIQPVAGNSVFTDITEVAAGNGYSAGGEQVAVTRYDDTDAAGVAKLVNADALFTAGGGTIGPFKWAVLYNSSSAGQPLIGFWEYAGAAVTLQDLEQFLADFDDGTGNGTLTIG